EGQIVKLSLFTSFLYNNKAKPGFALLLYRKLVNKLSFTICPSLKPTKHCCTNSFTKSASLVVGHRKRCSPNSITLCLAGVICFGIAVISNGTTLIPYLLAVASIAAEI